MGHRASYAIREQGELRLFRSQWGALTVPEDLFFGPEHARRFIESLEPTDEWLDTTWAEGGAALDVDHRVAAFYGGDGLSCPPFRPVVESLMRHLWSASGWELRWVDGIAAVAATVGVDPATVEARHLRPQTVDLRTLNTLSGNGQYSAVLSRREAGAWVDRILDQAVTGTLMNGAAFLEVAHRLDLLETERARRAARPPGHLTGSFGDHLSTWVLVDDEGQRLLLHSGGYMLEEEDVPFLRERWPGWEVRWAAGGVEEHFQAMGRSVPEDLVPTGIFDEPDEWDEEMAKLSFEEVLEQIRSELLGVEERKDEVERFSRLAAGAVGEMNLGQSGPASPWERFRAWISGKLAPDPCVAPGYFTRIPASGPNPAEARRLFEEALAACEPELRARAAKGSEGRGD